MVFKPVNCSSAKPFISPIHGGAAGVEGPGPAAHVPGVQHRQGDGHQRHQHQGWADDHHHDEGAGHRHQTGEDADDVGGNTGAHHVDVVGHPADDVPGGIPVKVPHRQGHELVKDVVPQPAAHQLAQAHHGGVDQEGQNGGGQVADQHPLGVVPDHAHIHLPRPRRRCADGLSRQGWPQQAQHVAGQGQEHYSREKQAVVHDVPQHPAEGPLGVLWFFLFSGPLRRHVLSLPPLTPARPSGTGRCPDRRGRSSKAPGGCPGR